MGIQTAYKELYSLRDKSIYSVNQINWWLLKYGDLYKHITNNYNKLCNVCVILSQENLPYDCLSKPYCNKHPQFQPFLNFYNELDKVTQLHKLESQCSRAIDEYMTLICIEEDLKDWMVKHYDTYYKINGSFYSYMEFNAPGVKTLHIAEAPDKSFGITVREEDFKYSINFFNVYDDLYHNKKLYPEKLKEMDELFSKIKISKDEF